MEPRRTFPVISIADLERDLRDEDTAFEEFETADTIEVPNPLLPLCDDDDEGPTGVYKIAQYQPAPVVYWVQRV